MILNRLTLLSVKYLPPSSHNLVCQRHTCLLSYRYTLGGFANFARANSKLPSFYLRDNTILVYISQKKPAPPTTAYTRECAVLFPRPIELMISMVADQWHNYNGIMDMRRN